MTIPDTQSDRGRTAPVQHADAGAVALSPCQDQAAQPVTAARSVAERERILMAVREAGRACATPGPSAARSQDFLYDDDGLPG